MDAGALGDAVEKLDLAPGGQWQVLPPAGGLQRGGIFQFRLNGDGVAHGLDSPYRVEIKSPAVSRAWGGSERVSLGIIEL